MLMKKLSEEHYIVVDDSDIKIGDVVAEKLITGEYELFTIHTLNDIDNLTQEKVTHSTELINESTQPNTEFYWNTVNKLSLSEVKELLGVVDVEKKGEKKYPKSEFWVGSNPSRLYDENAKERRCYIEGYKEALEDNKEKKYTEEDMQWALHEAKYHQELSIEEIIQALHQPKTEWEVEFVDGKLKLKL